MKHAISFPQAHPIVTVALALAVLLGSGAVAASAVGSGSAARQERKAVAVQEPKNADKAGLGSLSASPSGAASPAASAQAPTKKTEALPKGCVLNAKLVPSCGLLWGVAPGAFTDLSTSQALGNFERATGRPADIVHSYHRGDMVWPTADEIATVRDGKRILFANWKVAWNTTWANVASGGQDARIDKAAARLKAFPGKLFVALHHEPENDVRPEAGSGMTARDYAEMFRYTVKRLRAAGVTNVVFVMVYMAYEPWCVQQWFEDLYPGDDVVDWIGMDPYLYAKPGNYGHGDFAYLVNRTSDPSKWPGFYNWVTRKHGNKPLMVSEWGVYEHTADLSKKPWIYSTVGRQIGQFPAIKALVYFDSPNAPKGDTRPDSSQAALTEFRKLADSTVFSVTL